jgi:hypothetical protein
MPNIENSDIKHLLIALVFEYDNVIARSSIPSIQALNLPLLDTTHAKALSAEQYA